jgi:hypothetical protein
VDLATGHLAAPGCYRVACPCKQPSPEWRAVHTPLEICESILSSLGNSSSRRNSKRHRMAWQLAGRKLLFSRCGRIY